MIGDAESRNRSPTVTITVTVNFVVVTTSTLDVRRATCDEKWEVAGGWTSSPQRRNTVECLRTPPQIYAKENSVRLFASTKHSQPRNSDARCRSLDHEAV